MSEENIWDDPQTEWVKVTIPSQYRIYDEERGLSAILFVEYPRGYDYDPQVQNVIGGDIPLEKCKFVRLGISLNLEVLQRSHKKIMPYAMFDAFVHPLSLHNNPKGIWSEEASVTPFIDDEENSYRFPSEEWTKTVHEKPIWYPFSYRNDDHELSDFMELTYDENQGVTTDLLFEAYNFQDAIERFKDITGADDYWFQDWEAKEPTQNLSFNKDQKFVIDKNDPKNYQTSQKYLDDGYYDVFAHSLDGEVIGAFKETVIIPFTPVGWGMEYTASWVSPIYPLNVQGSSEDGEFFAIPAGTPVTRSKKQKISIDSSDLRLVLFNEHGNYWKLWTSNLHKILDIRKRLEEHVQSLGPFDAESFI